MKPVAFMVLFAMAAMPASQTQAQKSAFEVTSVKPSPSRGKNISTNVDTSPGNLTITNVTVHSLVRWAYGSGGKTLADYQVSGGPDWVKSENYDLMAKPSAPVSERDQYRVMLQGLLAERLNLMLHIETKDLPVYVLTTGKSELKLTPSIDKGNVRSILFAPPGVILKNAAMSELAEFLAGLPAFGRPVLDKTGLDGRYDFALMLFDKVPEGDGALKRAIAGSDYSNYAYAVEQLGLKLEAKRAPVQYFVIDSVQRPSEN
jgi:uncharacterized protein (TIGR03435 family)